MTATEANLAELADAGRRAEQLAKGWAEASGAHPVSYPVALLARVLKDPAGVDFTVRFVDDVVRPKDLKVSAKALTRLAKDQVGFLPWYLAAGVRVAGVTARVLPVPTVAVARKIFRALVGDLVVDATPKTMGSTLARLRAGGNKLNVNLLGEAVLGDEEAERRLADTMALLERDDVDYVSIKVSAVTGPHNPWGFDEVVAHAVERLKPAYLRAAANPIPKFINLDMEDYKDLDLTIEVFKQILDDPALLHYEAGIVLQAYLPDALARMQELQEWSARRVAAGGARIKVRLVKGANLAMERVEAEIHDWPLTTWPSKQDTDTNYKRVLDYALRPEHAANVRVGVAGQNLFDVAFAWTLAGDRGVRSAVEFEMLSGMAVGQAEVVRREVGHLLLYIPMVNPSEFDVAIAYLVRRLEENSLPENFMSGVFEIATRRGVQERERSRFAASLDAYDPADPALTPNRTQNRATETAESITATVTDADGNWVYRATPDTDIVLPANRDWAAGIVSRIGASKLGVDGVAAATVDDPTELAGIVSQTAEAGVAWAAVPTAERAAILHRVGVELGLRRADLLEVAASECGKTLDQSDPEVSEAIDFAHYYARQAGQLDGVDGARFVPASLTVVTPPWNFPLSIPAGGVLAALAAGSAVILKPASPAKRCGALLAEAMWAAGVPKDVLRLVIPADHELGRRLVTDEKVDRVILTGSYDTAARFRSWRPELALLAETSGKNAIIVTPSADPDLAVKDVVASAFGHAGQKCSAASLVVLVGSVATSRRFLDQLVDAVRSLHVAWPTDPSSQMGPVVVPGDEKLQRGLTTLGEGESWLVEPKQLDETGRLWSPGLRTGIRPGSEFHKVEYFGPILGIMTAKDLSEAIGIVNAVDYGLTSGLHSLDPAEVGQWLDTVEAGNVYVNRSITGAIVERQSFGGWKRSAVGPGTKAGGPSYLYALGTWEPVDVPQISTAIPPASRRLVEAASQVLDADDAAFLSRAVASDQAAWQTEFSQEHDPTNLACEHNLLRYRPTPVTIRVDEQQPLADLVRLAAAGILAGGEVKLSSGIAVPTSIEQELVGAGVSVVTQTDRQWLDGAAEWAATVPLGARVRLVGDAQRLAEAVGGLPDIAIYTGPVTAAGRVELLPFLREQSVSVTAHRYGTSYDVLKLARSLG
ncbi:L-proline dehydrogenase [Tessaracoccus bendigoensis DSM 12906]|uniref:L-glutamate gamma-semialdehyde dehydrogenase n=1 Tax=Tessaracoccus bendigoensis DSM 12906 TaxID=1123357 RepID=A0A1M6KZJ1_9ACTN|nr:proline dehydrogenase family protein [Tessaracoccus bendigoensis]SHJ64302.1 L-proline dehydrogenase [Tessaracoccus bendigoensis DSM 12906]